MASAWGLSWGGAWGNSWGAAAVARRGGGGSKRRYQRTRTRIISLREQLERARKAKDAERIEAARVEALALAEAEGLKTEALRQAEGVKDIVAAVRALTKQINSEMAVVRRNTDDFRRAREQAIRLENEEIAIALLLIA